MSSPLEQAVSSPPLSESAISRRNAIVLLIANAFSGSIAPIAFSVGGLAGLYLLGPDKSLATLPVSFFNLGVALGALPAALYMRRTSRRTGFVSGTGVAMAGGLVCGLAVLGGSFWLFSLGMALLGFAGAFVQQYRFAASDYGSAGERARAVSLVLSGGIAAAVIGPQTVIYTRNLLDPIPFAGSYFAIIAIAGLAAVTLYGGLVSAGRPQPERHVRPGGRPLIEIALQPRFIIAVVCAIGSYALMSLMMTAAPLAMVGCGLGEDNAALGIQWHALAMFLPSFFTGTLINRYGAESIIAAGLLLLAGCAAAAVSGLALANFWIALVLLGVGWNFAFIGATTMLLATYTPEETGKVQGLNDALVFGSVAIASFASGRLYTTVGWHVMNWVSLPVIAICFAALAAAVVLKRRRLA